MFSNYYAPNYKRAGLVGTTLVALATLVGCGGTPTQPGPTPPPPGQADTTPPLRTNGKPSGTLPSGTRTATLELLTDEDATCRYSESPNIPYGSMTSQFSSTGGRSHSTSLNNLVDGRSLSFMARCQDAAGNMNTDDFAIRFDIDMPRTQSGIVRTLEGQMVNGKIEFFDAVPDSSPNGARYTLVGSGSVNGGQYRVDLNSANARRVRITGTDGRFLNMERNYTGDPNYTVYEKKLFDGKDPIPFWDDINRNRTSNKWPVGLKRADKSLTFYIDTRTNIGDGGANQTKEQRIQVFRNQLKLIYETITGRSDYNVIETNNPPPEGNGNVIVKFGIPPVSAGISLSGHVVDGGELKLGGVSLFGASDREELAGLLLFFGFNNSIKPSIANEPSSTNIEDMDRYLIGFSRFEPLGSVSKTIDGIVIHSYEPLQTSTSIRQLHAANYHGLSPDISNVAHGRSSPFRLPKDNLFRQRPIKINRAA